ncbi:MAG: haloacid dehalogenase [Anaerolineae bacterium]|nr:haloacid dehalogenase [Anaerolineae bacterium]
MDQIVEQIRDEFETKNAVRDAALQRSRTLIRHCANAIRATHREDFEEARALLDVAAQAGLEMVADLVDYPDLYHAGYTQDALKEYVEAQMVYAFAMDVALPAPVDLGVEPAAYLKGLAEAASEMRRHTLDLIRENRLERAERMMDIMDEVYDHLLTVDFPDAITGGLRRTTDMLRGVVQRTRGDLTTAIRQEMMRQALREFEVRVGLPGGENGTEIEDEGFEEG